MATKGVRVNRNDCERRFGRTIRSTRRAGLRKTLPARSAGVTPATASRRDRGPELGKGAFTAGAHLTCRWTGRSTDRSESRIRVPAGRGDGEARKGIVGTAGVGVLPKGRGPNPADGEQEGLRFSLLKAGPPRATVFENKRFGLQTSIRRVSAVTAGTPGRKTARPGHVGAAEGRRHVPGGRGEPEATASG